MTIYVECDYCGSEFGVKDAAAGRVLPCRECGEEVEVPRPRRRRAAPRNDRDIFSMEDDDDDYREYSERRGVHPGVLVGSILGGLIALGLVIWVVIAMVGGDDEPDERVAQQDDGPSVPAGIRQNGVADPRAANPGGDPRDELLRQMEERRRQNGGNMFRPNPVPDRRNPQDLIVKPKRTLPPATGPFQLINAEERFTTEEISWGPDSYTFAPHHNLLAVGSNDDSLLLFNTETQQELNRKVKLDTLGDISALAFTPDSTLLLSGGDTGKVVMWNVTAAGVLTEDRAFGGHAREVTCIRPHPTQPHVASGAKDNRLRYWDRETLKENFSVAFEREVLDIWFDEASTTLLATDGRTIKEVDVLGGKVTRTSTIDSRSPSFGAFSPDGKYLALPKSNDLQIVDAADGEELAVFDLNKFTRSVEFTPDGRYVAAGSSGEVNFWSIEHQKHAGTIPLPYRGTYVEDIAFAPNNKSFAISSSSAAGKVSIFDLPEARELAVGEPGTPRVTVAADEPLDDTRVGEIHRLRTDDFYKAAVAFSPGGKFLVAAGQSVRVFTVAQGKEISQKPISRDRGTVNCLAFTADGKTLLAGTSKQRIIIYKVSDAGLLEEDGEFVGHTSAVAEITVSSDGKTVLSAAGRVGRCWDLETKQQHILVEGFQFGDISGVHIADDDKTGYVSNGRSVAVLDLTKHQSQIGPIPGVTGGGQAAFSPAGDMLAIGRTPGIQLWSKAGKPLGEFRVEGFINKLKFSPDGKLLFVSSHNAIDIWSIERKQRVRVLDVSGIGTDSLAISEDGRLVAVPLRGAFNGVSVYRLPQDAE